MIVHPVYNLTLKSVTAKLFTMLLMLMMMLQDMTMEMTRKLIKPSTISSLSQSLHSFRCTLEVSLSHCILFMLQEKVLQKRTCLIHMDTLFKRARDIFQGCTLNWFDLEMQR